MKSQIEHIDNPKGYPDNAKSFHPKLRGPVDVSTNHSLLIQNPIRECNTQPRELEVDPRTGMKNYIANGVFPCIASAYSAETFFRDGSLGYFEGSSEEDPRTLY